MSGRPTKITPDILAKLETAFLYGHSDEEACLIAEIDHSTLYRYCLKHPNFARKKELLKNNPKMLARRNVIKKIEAGDIELSRWYLERKGKDEFGIRLDPTNTVEITKNESMDKIAELLKALLSNKQTIASPTSPAIQNTLDPYKILSRQTR